MSRKIKLLFGLAVVAIAGGYATRTVLVPAVNSDPVMAAPATKAGAFDHEHTELDAILKSKVKSERVDYASLKSDPSELNAYLGQLASVEESEFKAWSEAQQLAMLINLYNAATLKLVIDHYPVDSIKDIGGLFRKPWDIESLTLFGKTTTLNHLEHEILRKNYNEPRIHFAIVCAAKGCPALLNEAYTAGKLDAQLKKQGEQFIRDVNKNRVDAGKKTVYLSKIFDWFEDDFTKDGSVIEFVKPYFSTSDAKALNKGFKVKHTGYDWSLNKQ